MSDSEKKQPVPERPATARDNDSKSIAEPKEAKRLFGTFQGVFVPSILTILGVIMYLRLGWVVGQVGLVGTLLIVIMSSAITFLTGLSIAATATNMRVRGGGAYFMISRSFGLEAGAAIGLPLYFAQALGVAFYIAGFAESVSALMPDWPIREIGFVSLVVLTVLAYISADLALKAQIFIFILILLSLGSFFFGSGLTAPEITTLPLERANFWVVFAIFFPAVTGIEAGISMSGDLKDPSKSLPLGTLLAVVIGLVIYVFLTIFLWLRVDEVTLISNPMVMRDSAIVPQLIYLGLWGATLSSALGALLGAPRTLQALAVDRIVYPFIGKGFGRDKSPRLATAVTFMIAAIALALGDLNLIAPVLSMFFLTSYGALNLIAGVEGLIGNPSWRPSFKVPWSVSFAGAFACVATMLMIDAGSTLVAAAACALIYALMRRKRFNAHWADLRRSLLLFFARNSIYALSKMDPNARSWRPNVLVLSGSPTSRWNLIEMADAVTHGKGFLTIAAVVSSKYKEGRDSGSLKRTIREFLTKRNVPALVKVKFVSDFVEGVQGLISDYGVGPISPNTFLLGDTEKEENFIDFCSIIQTVYRSSKNVVIFRSKKEAETPFPIRSGGSRARQIDMWWGRQHDNATLMMTLSYMLKTSPEWVGSELVLKSLVRSEEERQGVRQALMDFVEESRIDATVQVYVQPEVTTRFEAIRSFCSEADLVLVGMRPPLEEETAEEYSEYYEQLIKETNQMPPTMMVLAGEDISFKDIFS